MPRKAWTVLIIASAAFLATGAEAQETQAPPYDVSALRELDEIMVPRLEITVDRLEGMEIVGPDGSELGEVEDVLVDRDNQVVAVAAELRRFLGLGEREVVIGLDQLGLQADRDKLTTALTKERLTELPEWDD